MGATRVGESKLVFGTTDEPYGHIQMITEEIAVDQVTEDNGVGDVKAVEFFNKRHRCSGTYTFFTGNHAAAPLIHVGDGTTVLLQNIGLAVYIEKASRKGQRKGWTVIDFEGTYWPFLGS